MHVTNASCGPSVTRYELQPDQGVKVSKIVGLADDIKLNLAVADLRIEAPIPGKAAVGIEVPNSENTAVMLRDLLESAEFRNSRSPITFAVGKDIAGKAVVADIAKMPHLLVAGATGSGKSVCINTLIMSYSTKFASAFYGPFRDVADSAPSFGDRKTYQQNPANRNEAIRESLIDEDEGADILMVKPVLSSLDIVRDIKENSLLPLAVYNVSGEYAMLRAAKNAGLIDYDRTLLEMMISFKRAGADIIISYHAKEIANLI